MVKGLTFEMCQKGHMTDEVHDEFVEAIKDLEKLHVSAITGDCTLLHPLLSYYCCASTLTSPTFYQRHSHTIHAISTLFPPIPPPAASTTLFYHMRLIVLVFPVPWFECSVRHDSL